MLNQFVMTARLWAQPAPWAALTASCKPALRLLSMTADERHRLMAAARLAILELETNARTEDDTRRYFAKPGEAEWGC